MPLLGESLIFQDMARYWDHLSPAVGGKAAWLRELPTLQ